MALKTFTYDLTGGNTTIDINGATIPTSATKISYQLQGDGAVNGTVTVKIQEANIYASGLKDVVSATAIANVGTSEYVGQFDVGGAFLNFDVTLGAATVGTITMTIETS